MYDEEQNMLSREFNDDYFNIIKLFTYFNDHPTYTSQTSAKSTDLEEYDPIFQQ